LLSAGAAVQLPHYDHIEIVVEENHAASQIIGNKSAPFINALAAGDALMTQSYAVAHPSQPNYLALFAGDTFGVDSDVCPRRIWPPNFSPPDTASADSPKTCLPSAPRCAVPENMPANTHRG
jgi:hypothetical protein